MHKVLKPRLIIKSLDITALSFILDLNMLNLSSDTAQALLNFYLMGNG